MCTAHTPLIYVTTVAYPVHVGMSSRVKPDSQVWMCRVMVVRLVRMGEGPSRVGLRHAIHLAKGVWLDTYEKNDKSLVNVAKI